MDENSLYSLRRDPPEEFARRLQASLPRQTPIASSSKRVGTFIAIAASCVAVTAAFTVPSVRAAAKAFLDLFRVVHFAAVPTSSMALERLREGDVDLPHLLGQQIHMLQEPQAPTSYPTPAQAGEAAGFHALLPTWMPVGWDVDAPAVELLGARSARITADTARLKQILAALDIQDVAIPENLDGQSATIRMPPAVVVKWQHNGQTLQLLQSPTPQADFPAGMDLVALGEIGLRILGLSSADAYRFAQSIDWRTTLLVPVPANVVSFRQVTVRGSSGLLLEQTQTGSTHRRRAGAMLLWSDGTRVFVLNGTVPSAELVEMAQSLQ